MTDIEKEQSGGVVRGDAGTVTGGEVTIRQGRAHSITAREVIIRQGGAGRIQAQGVEITQGGVVVHDEVTGGDRSRRPPRPATAPSGSSWPESFTALAFACFWDRGPRSPSALD